MEENSMSEKAKRKYEALKNKAIQLLEERPLETIATASAAMLAVAKLIGSVNEARNARTWRREVQRREEKQRERRYAR
jgi:hypothetical protein